MTDISHNLFITNFPGLSADLTRCCRLTDNERPVVGRRAQLWDAKVPHPGLEVHRSSSVEQQSGYVDVPIVSGDVQRRETALKTREKERNR